MIKNFEEVQKVENIEPSKKKDDILNVKPQKLKDGTLSYSVPIRYPENILESLRYLWYEKKFKHMSDALFYCIENHENKNFINCERKKIEKKGLTNLCIRFRENHCIYIKKVCRLKGVNFTDGVIHILYEYLSSEKRL